MKRLILFLVLALAGSAYADGRVSVPDGGTTDLACTASTQGLIQTMDDGRLQWCDGAATSALHATGVIKWLTSDQTFNSATPANVTVLAFSVVSGIYYSIRCQFIYQSDTTTVGIALGATTPTFTIYTGSVRIAIGSDGASGDAQGVLNSSGDTVIGTTLPGGAINTDFPASLDAILLPSANGTFQVQAATETGTTVVTVRKGSMCSVQPLS